MGLARHEVDRLADLAVRVRGDEQMAVAAVPPMIPVPEHEVVDDPDVRLGQVRMQVRGRRVHLHVPRKRHVTAARRVEEVGDAALDVGDLPFARAVRADLPELVRAALVREEADPLAVGSPARGAFPVLRPGQEHGLTTRNRDQVEVRVTFVLLHAVSRPAEGDHPPVRRYAGCANARQAPQQLRTEYVLSPQVGRAEQNEGEHGHEGPNPCSGVCP